MKTPFSTTYRFSSSKLDVIESAGSHEAPHDALWKIAREKLWQVTPGPIIGDRLPFEAVTCRGETVIGAVYPSASTPQSHASL